MKEYCESAKKGLVWVRRSELTQEEWDAAKSHALRYLDGRMDIVDGPDLPDPEFGLRCCDLDGNDGAVALALVSAPVAGGKSE